MIDDVAGEAWAGPDWLVTNEARCIWRTGACATPFQHPAWLYEWWRAFARDRGDARVWVEGPRAGSQRGYAAWHASVRRMLPGRAIRRLQPLGQSEWLEDAFPGEYAWLCDREDACVRALEAAGALDWDELLVQFVRRADALDRALESWAAQHGFGHERFDMPPSWIVRTAPGGHAARLSANERRAVYGRRRAAERAGLEFAARGGTLEVLYALHDRRWGSSGMPAGVRAFLRAVDARCGQELEFRVSVLARSGVACSAMLMLESRGVAYQLQAGFDAALAPRLSPGKLHLGFEIARAERDPTLNELDLLAGRGLRSDYKARMGAEARALCAVRIVRSRWLRALRRLDARRLLRAGRGSEGQRAARALADSTSCANAVR